MSNKKQSSVEWLFFELSYTPKDKFEWHSLLRKAKAMHKDEMESAYLCGSTDSFNDEGDFKKYYKETFEGVPLLPPLEQEDDVEKLAEEEYPIIPNTSPNVNWDRANKQEGFERGYNKAKEKYKFTEDDMIKQSKQYYNQTFGGQDNEN